MLKNTKRKEVITMNYQKPEITLLAPAIGAIQGEKSGEIADNLCPEPGSSHTDCTYRSDE